MSNPKIDSRCECVSIQPVNRLVKVDGIPLCQVVTQPNGEIWLRFKDRHGIRNKLRGCDTVEIPLNGLIGVLTNI